MINKLNSVVSIFGTNLVGSEPTDPSGVVLEIEDPLGSSVFYTYGTDEEVIRVSAGQYRFDLNLNIRGVWKYYWRTDAALLFASGQVECAQALTLEVVNDQTPSSPIAFVLIKAWDDDGNPLVLEQLKTDSLGSMVIEVNKGTYRISAYKMNYVFQPTLIDVTESLTVQIVGSPPKSGWLQWEDLETIVDKAVIDRLFTDSNLAVRDMQLIESVIQQAEAMAESQLLRSWPQEQIKLLAINDPAIRNQAAWLALEFASERRQEFIAVDGKGRYWAQYERAIQFFNDLSKSKSHSKGEEVAGKGGNSGGFYNPKSIRGQSRRVFANEPDGSGHGGF